MENISRRDASYLACKLSFDDIRRYNNSQDMTVIDCWDWNNGLSAYIEIVYNGTKSLFDEIVADFNSNNNRKFLNSNGKEVSYFKVMDNFLIYMGRPENARKRYTANNFNKYLVTNYTEI